MEKKKIYFIGGLHFFLDSYMGFFAVYLVIAGLDPLKSAIIITITMFAGNILQPIMGYTADRTRGKMPLFIGLFLTSVSMSMIGLTTSYTVLFVLVLFGQLGSALFHPAGANIAGAAGMKKKGIQASRYFRRSVRSDSRFHSPIFQHSQQGSEPRAHSSWQSPLCSWLFTICFSAEWKFTATVTAFT